MLATRVSQIEALEALSAHRSTSHSGMSPMCLDGGALRLHLAWRQARDPGCFSLLNQLASRSSPIHPWHPATRLADST